MKTKLHVQLLALVLPALLSTLSPQLSAVFAQGTAFIYQGRLNENGSPYTGSAEVQPTLWDAVANGTQLATNNPASTVVIVTDGLFVLPLDFGNHFSGADRWLQLEVRTTLGPFTTLTPRQQLTPTPYAIYSASALTARGVATNSITVTQLLTPGAPAPGQVLAYDGNGFVWTNPPTSSPGWALTGNSGTSPTNENFVGTTDNQPLEIRVNGQRVIRFERQTNSPFGFITANVIGGYENNFVSNGVAGATISGGGGPQWYGLTPPHTIGGQFGTIGGGVGNVVQAGVGTIAGGERETISYNAYNSFIGGGANNTIDAPDSVIGGGRFNAAQSNGYAATISGGYQNIVRTNSQYSTIAGGSVNTIQSTASSATISGGSQNTVGGSYGTVPGGYFNSAAAPNSFAAGTVAQANHNGSFVWADNSSFSFFTSTTENQFNVRAVGGVRLVTSGAGLTVDGVSPSKETVLPDVPLYYSNVVNVLHGSTVNSISTNAIGATISGGGVNFYYNPGPYGNSVSNDFGTVGGGVNNRNGGWSSTIGGGANNRSTGDNATIAGGNGNWALTNWATVGGGSGNFASGLGATVPGGLLNSANGSYSFAAGYEAYANHNGTFVWGDSQGSSTTSTAINQFLIRASGGVGINTASPGAALEVRTTNTTGNVIRFGFASGGVGNLIAGPSRVGIATDNMAEKISIAQGSGYVGINTITPQTQLHVFGPEGAQLLLQNNANNKSWSLYTESFNNTGNLLFVANSGSFIYFDQSGFVHSASDKRLKRDIAPMGQVLDRVMQLRPVSYHFRDQTNDAPRTLGLLAQEVEPLFPEVVGEHAGMKALAYSELVPVTIGAVQELNAKLEEQRAENAELKQRLEALEKIIRNQKLN